MRRFFDYEFDGLGASGRDAFIDFVSETYFPPQFDLFTVPLIPEIDILEMSGDDYASDTSTTGLVVVDGSSVSGSIETSGDRDWFAFTVTAGQDVSFSVTGGISALIRFYDDAGNALIANEDFIYFRDAVYTFADAGTYYIGLGTQQDVYTGNYTLSAISVIDDFGASQDTAGFLTTDDVPVSGELELSYDRDWFEIDYVAGDHISIITRYTEISGIQIKLLDSSGIELANAYGSSNGGATYFDYAIEETGTFYIQLTSDARSYEDVQTDSYSITSTIINDDFSKAMPGTIEDDGVSVAGRFDYGGDEDYFQFEVTQTGEYGFILEGSDPDYLWINVLTPSGQRIYTPNTATEGSTEIVYDFNEVGTYHIIALGAPSVEGNLYTLRSTNIVDDYSNDIHTTGSLILDGTAASGVIDYVSDVDWFAVQLTAGEIVDFVLTGDLAQNLYPGLDLYNEFGIRVSSATNGSKNIPFEVTDSGTYFMSVGSENVQSTGSYSISASTIIDDFSGDVTTTGYLNDGIAIQASLETKYDADWFGFEVENGDAINFYLDYAGNISDFDVEFYSSTGSYLGRPQDLGDGVYRSTWLSEGDYFLALVSDSGTDAPGDYTIYKNPELSDIDDYSADIFTVGVISLDATLTSGVINLPGDEDWLKFSATEGDAVSFTLDYSGGPRYDYTLNIFNSIGELVVSNNNVSQGDRKLNFTAGETGDYYIEISITSGTVKEDYQISGYVSTLPSSYIPFLPVNYSPWYDLPDIGETPTNDFLITGVINVGEDFTIAESDIIYGYNLNDETLISNGSGYSLTNNGIVWIESNNLDFDHNASAFRLGLQADFTNNGYILALSVDGLALGVSTSNYSQMQNFGTIQAISYDGLAIGFYTDDENQDINALHNYNFGLIEAWSGTDLAYGVRLEDGASFVNDGTINATGFSQGVAILTEGVLHPAKPDVMIVNNGTLFAQDNAALTSIGILGARVDNFGVREAFNHDVVIDNTGTIIAPIAIEILSTNSNYETTLNNTGVIVGDIIFGAGHDIIINSGNLTGDVFFGEGNDSFDGSLGQFTGEIYLGNGQDIFIGGSSNENVDAGAGDDQIMGSAGSDIFDGGAGIDELSYNNSFSTASVGVSVNLETGAALGGDAEGDIFTNFENLSGSNFDDSLTGDAGINSINGFAGNDFIDGGDGDDILNGGAGSDILNGGEGNDLAVYNGDLSDYNIFDNGDGTYTITDNANGNGSDILINVEDVQIGTELVDLSTIPAAINGTSGNDNLMGSHDDDVINGLGGNDILDGLAGDDTINGGDGADRLIGGIGADALNGGAGFDSADYRGASSAVRFNVDTGGTLGEALGDTFSGIERYYLSNFNDIITGSSANEFFYGEDGNDQINGGGGIDRIYGGEGNDIQRGQDGNDTLYGSAGADQLNGGVGFDIANYTLASAAVVVNMLSSGTGGDAAGDTYFGIEAVYGSDFDDSLTGNNSVNELRGGDGNDTLFGLGGNDRFFGGAGADSFDGGTGIDIVNYTQSTSGQGIRLINGGFDNSGAGSVSDSNGDTYTSIEWVFGSDFNDIILGDDANNRLEGRAGSDFLAGSGGNDRLLGGDGNDSIQGGDGNDTIFGQDGDDNMDGGRGNDFFFGGAGADSHDGDDGTDTVSYLASSSGVTLNMTTGGTGGDAAGDSYVRIERIFGSSHDDSIVGSVNNDILIGNGGNDYLAGGNGNDSLNGGAGLDSFGYNENIDDADVIQGFTTNEVIYLLGGDPDFDTWAEVQAVGTDAAANVIFDFGGGNTLTVVGRNLADLDASNFDFSGTPPAGEPLSDPDAFAADVVDDFDMDALI